MSLVARLNGNVNKLILMESPHYLILSSHKNFWIKDKPLLLLGQWCINGLNLDGLKNEEIIFAEPYGSTFEQRDADHTALCEMEDRLFSDLCSVLNATHGVDHSLRYWRILIGQWFRTALAVVFNRTRTLQACLAKYAPVSSIEPIGEPFHLARVTSIETIWAYSDPEWDGHFCLRILKQIAPDINLEKCPTDISFNSSTEKKINLNSNISSKILMQAWKFSQKFTKVFVRENDGFIINSYLPKLKEIELQLALGQFPQIWRSPQVRYEQNFDFAKRRCLAEKLWRTNSDNVESVARELLFEIIPLCYLEGYQHLLLQSEKLPWPKDPKFIFTSNNFGTDELFKVWVAGRVQRGVKYVVGQHGNNYGTHRYMNPSVEEETSDAFITWGWKGKLRQHIPGINLKINKSTKLNSNNQGGLLLVEVWAGHRITTWDNFEQYLKYLKEQHIFAKELPVAAKSQLTVRLHHDSARQDWNERELWRQFDPNIYVDPGFGSIQNRIRNARLVVHSYDSTGLLETLALNIPSLAFWQNGLNHLRDEVKGDFQKLIDVNIVHLSPESAASTVNVIWDDVRAWWAEPKRQIAIKDFCMKYSRLSARPSHDIKQLLEKVSYNNV